MLVKNWMNRDLVTVDVHDSMEEALRCLREHDVPMLPVLRKGRLVGIVTDRDLKRASASDATTLEIHELLYLITTIKDAADVLRDFGGRTVSILSSRENVPEGRRKVWIRVQGVARGKLPELLAALQSQGEVLYFVDHRDGRREILA